MAGRMEGVPLGHHGLGGRGVGLDPAEHDVEAGLGDLDLVGEPVDRDAGVCVGVRDPHLRRIDPESLLSARRHFGPCPRARASPTLGGTPGSTDVDPGVRAEMR